MVGSGKYEAFVQVLCGEMTVAECADRWGVDRSTIMRARDTACRGALGALASPVGSIVKRSHRGRVSDSSSIAALRGVSSPASISLSDLSHLRCRQQRLLDTTAHHRST